MVSYIGMPENEEKTEAEVCNKVSEGVGQYNDSVHGREDREEKGWMYGWTVKRERCRE